MKEGSEKGNERERDTRETGGYRKKKFGRHC